jgi:hypothetical protein
LPDLACVGMHAPTGTSGEDAEVASLRTTIAALQEALETVHPREDGRRQLS